MYEEKSYELYVAKRNDLIQRSHSNLSLIEQKILYYCIAQIKPDDKPDTEYVIDCSNILGQLCDKPASSYTRIKRVLLALKSRCWIMPDIENPKIDRVYQWIDDVWIERNTSIVKFTFDNTVSPFLFNLLKQRKFDFFTAYEYENIVKMKSKYSVKLYEILKSYSNNTKWIFEFGTKTNNDLISLLSDVDTSTNKVMYNERWTEWRWFNQHILKKSVDEINNLTDIKVTYTGKKNDLHGVKTASTSTVEFTIDDLRRNIGRFEYH